MSEQAVFIPPFTRNPLLEDAEREVRDLKDSRFGWRLAVAFFAACAVMFCAVYIQADSAVHGLRRQLADEQGDAQWWRSRSAWWSEQGDKWMRWAISCEADLLDLKAASRVIHADPVEVVIPRCADGGTGPCVSEDPAPGNVWRYTTWAPRHEVLR